MCSAVARWEECVRVRESDVGGRGRQEGERRDGRGIQFGLWRQLRKTDGGEAVNSTSHSCSLNLTHVPPGDRPTGPPYASHIRTSQEYKRDLVGRVVRYAQSCQIATLLRRRLLTLKLDASQIYIQGYTSCQQTTFVDIKLSTCGSWGMNFVMVVFPCKQYKVAMTMNCSSKRDEGWMTE